MKSLGYPGERVGSPWEAPVVNPGFLERLKTRLEIKAKEDVIDVYIVDIPAKCANELLNNLRRSFEDLDKINLQHLRRFVKPEFLPAHLRQLELCKAASPDTYSEGESSNSRRYSKSKEDDSNQGILSMLVSPTRTISRQSLTEYLSAFPPFSVSEAPPIPRVIPVPLLPPTTSDQAEQWSQKYWPTVYKCTNPYGPHPSIVSRAEQNLTWKAGHFMSLAAKAGRQANTHGLGEAVGAVIAGGMSPDSCSLTIVAGDARWYHSVADCEESGNVMGHAVMRAIGMVARKRLLPTSESEDLPSRDGEDIGFTVPQNTEAITNAFLDQPLTPIEDTYYRQSPVSRDGYLCVDLDIYTTHEPCIMCSMAILHSRFRGVIFGQRMVRTGGLTAEVVDQTSWRDFPTKPRDNGRQEPPCDKLGGLGYGMFWRDELNWKLLAWQWKEQGQSSIPEVHQNTHA